VTSGSAEPARSCSEIETFLRNANLKVLGNIRAVMDNGVMQHPVFIHTSDETYRPEGEGDRDTWKAAVAAYELAKILQINITPPQVEIRVDGTPASVSWGLDGVIMDEAQRTQRNVQPPDADAFNRQMDVLRVFEELLYKGAAPTDLLFTTGWQLWILTPSQAFLPSKTLRNPANLVRCDRKLLAKMRTLETATLAAKLGRWLTEEEIDGLYARTVQIVGLFDGKIASKGEGAVLFDLDRSGSSCAL
jgi:hypothetical protein